MSEAERFRFDDEKHKPLFVLLWRRNNRFGDANWPQHTAGQGAFRGLPVTGELRELGQSLWQMRAGGYVAVHGMAIEWKFNKISAMLAAMPPRLVTLCRRRTASTDGRAGAIDREPASLTLRLLQTQQSTWL